MKKILLAVILPLLLIVSPVHASDTLSVQDSLNVELTKQQIKHTQAKRSAAVFLTLGLAVILGIVVGNAVGEGVSK